MKVSIAIGDVVAVEYVVLMEQDRATIQTNECSSDFMPGRMIVRLWKTGRTVQQESNTS